MKTMLIFGGFIGLIVLIIAVLSSATESEEGKGEITGVTGPLEVGCVSRSKQSVDVWRESRYSYGRKDREELRAGRLEPGDVFVVLKHQMVGGNLWVKIRGEDVDIEGWVASPTDDPFLASKVKGQ